MTSTPHQLTTDAPTTNPPSIFDLMIYFDDDDLKSDGVVKQKLPTTEKTRNKFSVHFSSRSAQRKVEAAFGQQLPAVGTVVTTTTTAAATIPQLSEQQQNAAGYFSKKLLEANIRDFENTVRQPEDELHYIKSLVLEGLFYQRQNNQLEALARKIFRASSVAVTTPTKQGGAYTALSTAQASNLKFVAHTLFLDVEDLLVHWGYTRTLKALMQMKLWDLDKN